MIWDCGQRLTKARLDTHHFRKGGWGCLIENHYCQSLVWFGLVSIIVVITITNTTTQSQHLNHHSNHNTQSQILQCEKVMVEKLKDHHTQTQTHPIQGKQTISKSFTYHSFPPLDSCTALLGWSRSGTAMVLIASSFSVRAL